MNYAFSYDWRSSMVSSQHMTSE